MVTWISLITMMTTAKMMYARSVSRPIRRSMLSAGRCPGRIQAMIDTGSPSQVAIYVRILSGSRCQPIIIAAEPAG